MTDDEIRAHVERTTKASGVPFFVEDPAVLALVADIILAHKRRELAEDTRRRR